MKYYQLGLNSEQVVEGLRAMQPRNEKEKELIVAAIEFVEMALEKVSFTDYMRVKVMPGLSMMGRCPVCNHKLEFNGLIDEMDDVQTCEGWNCPHCGLSGLEFRKTVFNGHALKVLTDKGHLNLQGGHANA